MPNTRPLLRLAVALAASSCASQLHADSVDARRSCIVSIGDLDGDGLRDMLVANRDPEARECVWAISSKTGKVLFRAEGTTPGDGFGGSLSEIGDVNGDRLPDLIVSAWGTRSILPIIQDGMSTQPVFVSKGYARICSGKDGSTLVDIRSAWDELRVADCVSGAGDVNGDGVPDVLIGDVYSTMAVGVRVDHHRGVVRVHSGADGALIHLLTSPASGRKDSFGAALTSLGDIDGDGHGDFAVSAPTGWPAFEPGQTWPGPGAVFVFSGRTARCLHVIASDMSGDFFGWTIAAAKHPALAGSSLLAVSCPSRTVGLYSTSDWSSIRIATSHSMPGYLDDFGSSMEFALDPKTKCATAIVIGASENDFAFDEGYAEVYPLDRRPKLVLVAGSREGIDVCALDDVDGDGNADFAYVGVKSMTLSIVSGGKGETLRTLDLQSKPSANPR